MQRSFIHSVIRYFILID